MFIEHLICVDRILGVDSAESKRIKVPAHMGLTL